MRIKPGRFITFYFFRLAAASVALFILLAWTAKAQVVPLYDVVYRPPGISYSVLRGEHFDIIFENGFRAEAGETLHILESSLAGTDSLSGSRTRLHMPVVLNGFNDRANGFVTPYPFKQEIAVTSIKGRALSRRHPSWISAVATHELMHAVQADFSDGVGLVGLVNWFSPDFARSLNMFVPPGIAEGIAVYRESTIVPGAGRLNHPYFLMQFRAALEVGTGWSLAQMLEAPAYTRPFDRYYEGGAHLVSYLVETEGEDFVHRLARWQYRFPFLGYGANLIYATGRTPWRLGRDVRAWYRDSEHERLDRLGPIKSGDLVRSRKGTVYRRPRWDTDSTIVAFALGYNLRRGFYRIHANTGQRRKIFNSTVTEDASFSFSADSSSILFSRYVQDPLVSIRQSAVLHRYDQATRKLHRLTGDTGILNPVETEGGRVFALQNRGQFNAVVELSDSGEPVGRLQFSRADFVGLLPRPGTDTLAVILNVRGHQALFVSRLDDLSESSMRPWIGFEDATIYDASWSANGRYLSFTADPDGVMNVFVADASQDRIWRITNTPYGAMEPAMSPDNTRLVFVEYRDERFDLRTILFRPEQAVEIDRNELAATQTIPWRKWLEQEPEYYAHAEVFPYRSLKYLAPRMLYPTIYLDSPRRKEQDARLGFGLGLGFQGTDPLQKWRYYGEGIIQKSRFFGEAGIHWGGTLLRPSIRVFNRPQTLTRILKQDGAVISKDRFIRERQGISAGIRIPITLSDNVYRSVLTPILDLNFRRDQFLDDDYEPIAKRVKHLSLTPGLIFGYRLQQNARDIVLNTGLIIRGFADIDLSSTRSTLQRGVFGLLDLYLPALSRSNTGIHLYAGILNQNVQSVFNLDFFLPRGREDEVVPPGTFLKYGVTITQPVLFIDDGFVILPAFFKAVYVYGFGEYMHGASDSGLEYSSVGGGIGVKLRLFHVFDLDLKYGAAYLPDSKKWRDIFR